MTTRAQQPDTAADIKLRELLNSDELAGFTMIAGAGSGKTTSLIKALSHVVKSRGSDLRRRTQRIACVTYTEGAAREIHEDVGADVLVHVSTIHSFLWSVVRPFQRDIAVWARSQALNKLQKLTNDQATFGPRVLDSTRTKNAADIEKIKNQIQALQSVRSFRYGVGTDFAQGILGHEDIIQLGTQFILERPLLCKILARQYPFVFVDESQDTFPIVVDALRHVKDMNQPNFCLGFIGDPMQKVYPRGVGEIPLSDGWKSIEKPENFRSSRAVLDVMNHIRAEGDGLTQVSGRSAGELKAGTVHYFVLPADDNRSESLKLTRRWLDATTTEGAWSDSDPTRGAKVLVIAHRMAARRLGFEALYAAFHDSGSSSLKQGLEDGTAWPIKIFTELILPLAKASGARRVALLRQHSPLLLEPSLQSSDILSALARLRTQSDELSAVVTAGGPGSVDRALDVLANGKLLELDPRLTSFRNGPESQIGVVISASTIAALTEFMNCDVRELERYDQYLNEGSPYSTHQGVKGAEFQRVLVVLDDEEGNHTQFSYDKLLGIKGPSKKDRENESAGKETVFERTRKLLYVCTSRSTEDLAIVLYAHDVPGAISALRASGMPGSDRPVTMERLA